MPKCQYKNPICNRQYNISPPESKYSTGASPEYSKTAEMLENDCKTNFMKMMDVFKKINFLKKCRKIQKKGGN